MWPFSRPPAPPDTPRTASLAKRVDDLELDQLELREIQEKILTAIKKIQGRLIRRVQLAEDAEVATEEPTGGEPPIPIVTDPKAVMRQAAARLRASR